MLTLYRMTSLELHARTVCVKSNLHNWHPDKSLTFAIDATDLFKIFICTIKDTVHFIHRTPPPGSGPI